MMPYYLYNNYLLKFFPRSYNLIQFLFKEYNLIQCKIYDLWDSNLNFRLMELKKIRASWLFQRSNR